MRTKRKGHGAATAPKALVPSTGEVTTRNTVPKFRPGSKKRKVLEYLVRGNKLTALKAFSLFGVTALNSVVSELHSKDGVWCHRESVTVPDRNGDTCHVSEYSIPRESEDWKRAKFLLYGGADG